MKSQYKLLICMILLMAILPLVSAANFGTFKTNTDIPLTQICTNDTSICDLCNVSTIRLPDGTIPLINVAMTKQISLFNYTLASPNTILNGVYSISGFCQSGQQYSSWAYDLLVTTTGYELTTQNSVVYAIMFVILFFVFLMNIFFIGKLPGSNAKDEEGRILSINYLKYLRFTLWFVEWMLFIGITYLASNLAFAYLGEQMFAKALYMIFQISFALTPVILIVWICWIFAKMFHDKQFQRMLNRGIFPQGKL